MARKVIEHTISVLVADESEAKKVKEALDAYEFIGEGIISLDKDLKREDIIKTAATKGFIRFKK